MESSPVRVLFVDDEPHILSGLRRQCRSARPGWHARFAESGSQAIRHLESEAADIVVSDMRMPVMNGAELLDIVRQRWPATHRIILSGQTDQSSLMEHVGAIHRFLQKPCGMDLIVESIEQSIRLGKELKESRLAGCVPEIESLPVLSEIYQELLDAVQNEDATVNDISAIVSRDIGLSVKVLQLVNSAFYCLPKRVESITDAVHRIGFVNLKSLVLVAKIFESLNSGDRRNAYLSHLWHASTDLGAQAEMYARVHGQPVAVCESARLAGTLSLIGRAILIAFRPEPWQRAMERAETDRISLAQAEADEFGVSQQTVGAYALGIWAFENKIVDAVLNQGSPAGVSDLSIAHPAVYVHAARSRQRATKLVERLEVDVAGMASIGFDLSLNPPLEGAA